MKSFIVLFALIGYIACESTIYHRLKVGQDAVYKLEHETIESYMKPKNFEKTFYDMYFRKSLKDHAFIVQFRNYRHEVSNAEDAKSDQEKQALELPIMVTLNDKFEFDHIDAYPNDTKKSVAEKYEILDLMIMDMGELVAELPEMLEMVNSVSTNDEMDEMPFGNCNVNMKLGKAHGEYYAEIKAMKHQCTGPIDPDLLEDMGITELSRYSSFKMGFYFDQETRSFNGFEMKVSGKELHNTKHTFKIRINIRFEEFKPIDSEIPEAGFTVKYTEADLKQKDDKKE